MSGGSSKFDCQKFSPNIFNKSKCQHCFRSKDQHSSEALENNRATRKISKCGYLFVAPDWDFSIPMNRTKRWQRRWFVLYEDGELTYSVDEHPDTIPQAIIDMTKVVDVSDAEEATGNKFSIGIATADKIHFVKGTCKEESRWWFDVLVIYPRNLNGRLKRNVTLPCVKSTPNISQSGIKSNSGQEVRIGVPRPRFNSCHSELGGLQDDEPLRDSTSSALNTSKSLLDRNRDDALAFSNREQKENGSAEDILNGDKFGRSRRYQRRDGKKINCHRSKSLGAVMATSSSLSQESVDGGGDASTSPASNSVSRVPSPLYLRLSDVPLTKRYDSLECLHLDETGPLSPKSLNHAEDETDSRKPNADRVMKQQQLRKKVVGPEVANHDGASQSISSSSSRSHRKSSSSTSTTSMTSNSHNCSAVGHQVLDEPWREHQIRGDPDGCGLDHMVRCPSSIPEIRVDPLDYPAEEYLNIKKGWLMKMEMTEEWKKRWCVLMGSLFTVYLDSAQEDVGKPSVVMHMDHVQHIEEIEVGRNYGLKIKMLDGNSHVFSAVTATFRSNWIYALKNAANASGPGPNNFEPKQLSYIQQKAPVNASEERISCSLNSIVTPTLSSDNEKRSVTGALISDRSSNISNSSNSSNSSSSSSNRVASVNKGVTTGSNQPRNLPPSPPLNRTVISKVKERARLKTNVRVSSRTTRASSKAASSGETEQSEVVLIGSEDHETRRTGNKEGTAVKEIARSPSKLFNVRLKEKSRRYTLPGRLDGDTPEASDAASAQFMPDSRVSSTRSSSSRTARLLRDKSEVKLRGDSHCSSIHERDRIIEILESRLQKSEGKLFDLRNEMERLLKSRDDTQLRLHAELSLKELENERLRLELLPDGDEPAGCRVDVKIVEDGSDEVGRQEMAKLKEALDRANGDLVDVVNKLQATVDENETLRKLLMIDKVAGDSKRLVSRVNSLSDLTNVGDGTDIDALDKEAIVEKYAELRARFEKAINEIKCLRRELKEAHGRCDGLEVELINQKQCTAAMNDDYRGQLRLMSDRIEDLTSKLCSSEKQLRHLTKQKGGKQESERKRTRSLKGREALTVSKEVESKVDELERKLRKVEGLLSSEQDVASTSSGGGGVDQSQTKAAVVDPRHIFVRLNSLESKVSNAIETAETRPPPQQQQQQQTEQSSTYSSRLNENKGDTPVTLISELNSQIEELKSRTTDLEMALLGFRQKIEKCKDLLEIATSGNGGDRQECLSNVGRHLIEALKWLDGSNIGVEASNMAVFFSRISAGMSDIVKSRLTTVHQSTKSHSDPTTQEVLLSKQNQESNMLNVLAQSMPIDQCDSFDHQHVIAEHSLALLELAKRAASTSLENSSELSWIVGRKLNSSRRRRCRHDSRASELDIGSLVKEMKEMEGTIGNLATSWCDKWRDSFVTNLMSADGNVAIISEKEFRDLPAVLQTKECFSNARMTLAQKLAEIDVVAVVSNVLHFSGSNFLPDVVSWLQRVLDRRTELVIEAINRTEENFIRDAHDGCKQMSESKSTGGNHRSKQRICSEQEFANALVQLTFILVCLPFLSALLKKGDWPTKSQTLGFDSPPLPRVVGELVKPEFRYEIQSRMQEATNSGVETTTATCLRRRESVSDGSCKQCKELQRKVQQMAEKYANDLLLETERHQVKLEVLYQKHADSVTMLEADHQERERLYCEEVQSLQGKLSSLEDDYEQQLFSLKELFEHELAKRTDVKINKVNVQLKYRAEIDQLKNLCEKGLVAMEHSHRRVVAELEEKHRLEMERLCTEKEQALAEETHATLAALDAMRKAHEAELQKEVANFKDDFLRKMGRSSAADLDAIHRDHQEEMETIKREILLLSENYSVKCLECAALEEHVEVVTNQLAETNSLIFDLTARNKQLNSHLKQSMRDLSCLSKDANVNLLSSRDPITMKELKIHLKLKDSQLIEKDEEIAELNRKLAATKNQQNELESQCRLLDASVKAGNRSCEEDMGTLRTRLENIIMSSSNCLPADGMRRKAPESVSVKQQIAYHMAEPKAKQKVIIGSNVRARELMRSPSCPGLSVGNAEIQSPSTSPLLMHQLYNKAPGLPSAPMVGVVASRKKIFEHPEK